MIIADKSSYSSDIYYGIVVNTASSDDPEGLDRVQIYIPSAQYEYADKYKEYMNSNNKSELEDFTVYPWASTLVSGLSVGDAIYGGHIDNDNSKYIILGVEGGSNTGSGDNNNDNDNDDGDINNLTSEKLMDLIMPIIMRNEVGITDYSAWGKDTIPTSYYTNITLHDGSSTNCWAIGLIQWNGANAFDTLYRCAKACGNDWTKDFPKSDNLYKDIKNAISDGSSSKYRTKYCKNYNPTEGGTLYKAIKKVLGYDKAKKAQRDLAVEYIAKITDMLQDKGVDNPAILIYLADLMNQYGTGLSNTIKTAVNACKKSKLNYMQQLDLVVKEVKKFATYNDYKNRRERVYKYIENLYKDGKLTSSLVDKTDEGSDNDSTGTYGLPFKKLYDVSFGYHVKYSSGKPHRGVDFKCPSGTKLYACTDGTIESYDSNKGTTYAGKAKRDTYWYGHFCVIHSTDGHTILYCHMKKTAGKKGKIKKGDYIGLSDDTGNSFGAHLHLEIRTSDTYGTEVDPMPFLGLDKNGKKLPAQKSSTKGSEVVKYAKSFIGKANYVYGAKDSQAPNTFDCASFTKYVYKNFKYTLHRPACDQARYDGTSVATSKLQAGDLIFYKGNSSRWKSIGHVAIYCGNNQIVHAANSKRGVTTDTTSSGYYSVTGSKFVMAVRVLK